MTNQPFRRAMNEAPAPFAHCAPNYENTIFIGTWNLRFRAVIQPTDTGVMHGPTSDKRGIDCGCGWGELCTAHRYTGRPYSLCECKRLYDEYSRGY